MVGVEYEEGTIQGASLILAPVVGPNQAYPTRETLGVQSTSFAFSRKDSGFISFTHSIGWRKQGLAHYELELIDPGNDFVREFIASQYHNRNANHRAKAYYISYGVGQREEKWSPVQIAYLIRIDVDIVSNGARKYILTFGSLPSLMNNPSSEGWPLVDWMGQRRICVGKAGYKKEHIIELIFKSVPGQWRSNAMKSRGTAATRASVAAGTGRADALKAKNYWIDFLDESVYLCVKRYIGNITGLGPRGDDKIGNVIVLLPSFMYTNIIENVDIIKTSPTVLPGADWRKDPSAAMNEYVFRNFSNLKAFDIEAVEQGRIGQGASGVGTWSSGNKRNGWTVNPLRTSSDAIILFQANNNNFKEFKTIEDARIDWMQPLKDLGNEFRDELFNIGLRTTGLTTGIMSGKKSISEGQELGFGTFDYKEIEDAHRLNILYENGVIGRTSDRCFVWGEANMVNLFLGDGVHINTEDEKVEDKFITELIKVFPRGLSDEANQGATKSDPKGIAVGPTLTQLGAKIVVGNPTTDEGATVLAENNLDKVHAFVNNESLLASMDMVRNILHAGVDNIIEMDKMVKQTSRDIIAAIEQKDGSHVLYGRRLLPIFRSGVRNSNVIDARIQMNPHYWGALAGTTQSMITTYSKREKDGGPPVTFNLTNKILKQAGMDKDDPEFKLWLSEIEKAVRPFVNTAFEENIPMSDLKDPKKPFFSLITEAMLAVKFPPDFFVTGQQGHKKNAPGGKPWTGVGPLVPGIEEMVKHIFASFAAPDAGIYNKLKAQQVANDVFNQTQLFYERVYQLAGPQLDITMIPTFLYSSITDIGRHVYVLMRQPPLMAGIDDSNNDPLALPHLRKTKKTYTHLGSGIFFILAFEHRISQGNIDSRFRLVKSPHVVEEPEVEEFMDTKISTTLPAGTAVTDPGGGVLQGGGGGMGSMAQGETRVLNVNRGGASYEGIPWLGNPIPRKFGPPTKQYPGGIPYGDPRIIPWEDRKRGLDPGGYSGGKPGKYSGKWGKK
jgi:hypothetical protein